MTIDKLSRLFSALGQSTQNYQSNESTNAKPSSQAGSEAVKVVRGFGDGAAEAGDTRKNRVEELKQAVADGTYKPDTREIAEAVVRELFS